MNERIRELALEARIAYYSKNGSYEGSDDGLSVIPSTQSLEKFAELIVRECMSVARQQRNPANLNYKPSERFVEDLRQHFGVEE